MITIAEQLPTLPSLDPEPDDATRQMGPFAVIAVAVLERAIEALSAPADFAGSAELLGRPDTDIVNPHFRAGHYRALRAVRVTLIEELANG